MICYLSSKIQRERESFLLAEMKTAGHLNKADISVRMNASHVD